jgi:hypothetical protein
MANQKFIFMAGGDACGACSALAGTISDTPLGSQHENCMCDSIPLSAGDDCPSYTAENTSTERYGPGGGSARMYFDIEVTCCDGTTIGETFVIDLGEEPGGRDFDAEFEEIDADVDQAAEELAQGCPEDPDDNVA